MKRGVCYSISNSEPTVNDAFTSNGTGIGSFNAIVTNVSVSTTYYVRAYATNSVGTGYGEVIAITTENGLPSVTTTAIGDNVTETTAILGGQVTDDGGYTVTARGVCWNTLPYPTINDNKTTNGSGTGYYSSTITNIDLTGTITYYVRAYATNANGTVYGNMLTISKENLEYANLPTIQYAGYTYKLYKDIGVMDWYDAKDACENLVYGGYDDWVLPENENLLMHIMNNCTQGWKRENGLDFEYVDVSNPQSSNVYSSAEYWTSNQFSSGKYFYHYTCYYEQVLYNGLYYNQVSLGGGRGSETNHVRPVRKYLANQ
jgi:hypothetical protein